MRVYDSAMNFGGMDMRTVVLPSVKSEALVLYDDAEIQRLHTFMGRVVLETAPSGVHMPYAQRQQYQAGITMLKIRERNGAIDPGSRAGGLVVAALVQDSLMAAHYTDTLRALGSDWSESWDTTDLAAISYNSAAVRSLRRATQDIHSFAGLLGHKNIGVIIERATANAHDNEDDETTPVTTLLGSVEHEWLSGAEQTYDIGAGLLMGVAAEFYGGTMQLRGTPNWARLHGLCFAKPLTATVTDISVQPERALAG